MYLISQLVYIFGHTNILICTFFPNAEFEMQDIGQPFFTLTLEKYADRIYLKTLEELARRGNRQILGEKIHRY